MSMAHGVRCFAGFPAPPGGEAKEKSTSYASSQARRAFPAGVFGIVLGPRNGIAAMTRVRHKTRERGDDMLNDGRTNH